ncbi:hypothetical protein [Spirosoma rigui]|uniref:hypothetical protein n=1 Tax=Spirosoma rigui TaxID=564064 RepID=UPI0009B13E40|nr:hypothetical protein [Spirosoma rigui]
MDPKKETWINDTLGSLDNSPRTDPSPFLFAKILHGLRSDSARHYVSSRTVWLALASFILLAALNWQLASHTTRSPRNELTTVVTNLHLYPANNQLYDPWSEQNY